MRAKLMVFLILMLIIGTINLSANEKIIRFTFQSQPDLIGRFQLNRLKEYAIIQNEALKNLFGYKVLADTYAERLEYYEKEMKKIKWKNMQIKILLGTTLTFSICFIGILVPIIVWFNLPQNGFI